MHAAESYASISAGLNDMLKGKNLNIPTYTMQRSCSVDHVSHSARTLARLSHYPLILLIPSLASLFVSDFLVTDIEGFFYDNIVLVYRMLSYIHDGIAVFTMIRL